MEALRLMLLHFWQLPTHFKLLYELSQNKIYFGPFACCQGNLICRFRSVNFESIVDDVDWVEAYIQEGQLNLDDLKELMIHNLPDLKVEFSHEIIEQQNWNAKWESQFEPIIVNDN